MRHKNSKLYKIEQLVSNRDAVELESVKAKADTETMKSLGPAAQATPRARTLRRGSRPKRAPSLITDEL